MKVTNAPLLLCLLLLLLLCSCVKHLEKSTSAPVSQAESTSTPSDRATQGVDDAAGMSVSEADQSRSEVVLKGQEAEEPGDSKSTPKAPDISLDELVERLKKTEAIGVFTKLAIRSDVLEFKESIDTYRKKGQFERYVGHLRDHFDGLLLKIITLLERDPDLSKDIHLARESIWKSLVEAKS